MAYFKCGNVSGNNDSMEWKLVGSTVANGSINLPSEWKEIKINSTYDGINYTQTLSKLEYDTIISSSDPSIT